MPIRRASHPFTGSVAYVSRSELRFGTALKRAYHMDGILPSSAIVQQEFAARLTEFESPSATVPDYLAVE